MLQHYPALIQENNTICFVEDILTNSSLEFFPILSTFEERKFLGHVSRNVLVRVIRDVQKVSSYYIEDVISFKETNQTIPPLPNLEKKESTDVELACYPQISETLYNSVPYALNTTRQAPKIHNIFHTLVFQPFRLCSIASMADAHTIFKYFDVETIWITENDILVGVLTKNQMLTYIRKLCNISLL